MSNKQRLSMMQCCGGGLAAQAAESPPGSYGQLAGPVAAEELLWAEGLQPRVLLAEDNLANLFLLHSQLQRLGCQVAAVSNGLEALEQWRQGQFDCLLTDLGMPQLDGFSLVQQLRAEGDKRPVIGISADPSAQDRQRAAAAGFDLLLAKPVSLPVLHTALLRFSLASSMQRLPVYADNSLSALFGADAALIRQFVHKLLSSNAQDLADAQTLFQAGRLAELGQVLHKIKGAARLIDAQQVGRSCEQLEKICQSGNAEQIALLLEELAGRLQALSQQLQGLL